MFQQIVRTLYVAFIAQLVRQKHALNEKVRFLPYFPHRLEGELVQTLSQAEGVYVHWGVCGSGKNRATEQAALKLQNVHGRTVILLSGLDLVLRPNDWLKFLKFRIGLPEDEPMSTYLTYPTTLIITHFDYVLKTNPKTLEDLKELKGECVGCCFNALLVMESWENAMTLKDVPALASPCRWTREELDGLFASLPAAIQDRWSPQQYDAVLSHAVLAGTPAFLIDVLEENRGVPRIGLWRAALLDLEWQMGTRALKDESLPWDAGRFPDKNMRYHWEDIKVSAAPASVCRVPGC